MRFFLFFFLVFMYVRCETWLPLKCSEATLAFAGVAAAFDVARHTDWIPTHYYRRFSLQVANRQQKTNSASPSTAAATFTQHYLTTTARPLNIPGKTTPPLASQSYTNLWIFLRWNCTEICVCVIARVYVKFDALVWPSQNTLKTISLDAVTCAYVAQCATKLISTGEPS